VVPFFAHLLAVRPSVYAGSLSPLVLIVSAGDTSYRASPVFYWASLTVIHAFAWALLVGAADRLGRTALDAGATTSPDRAIDADSAERRVRWESINGAVRPVEWLVRRQPGLKAAVWAAALSGSLY